MKALTAEHGLKGKIRVTASGCLDFCGKGIALYAVSDGEETWYGNVKPEEADAIFESHVLKGEVYGDRALKIRERGE